MIKMLTYHYLLIMLPLSIEVNDSEVNGPDESDVQHGVV